MLCIYKLLSSFSDAKELAISRVYNGCEVRQRYSNYTKRGSHKIFASYGNVFSGAELKHFSKILNILIRYSRDDHFLINIMSPCATAAQFMQYI